MQISGQERKIRLARDKAMNEARLNDARLHRARELRQGRLARYVEINEEELASAHF